MKSDDRIRAALGALAAADRGADAPDAVESRVLAGFRQARRRRFAWRGLSLLAAAAAVLAGILVVRPSSPRDVPVPPIPEPVAERAPVVAEEPAGESVEVAVAVVTPPAQSARPAESEPKAEPEPKEVVTDFYPLMDVMPPTSRASVYRVMVPASTMRKVGLPVSAERWREPIPADVLVGEEGMARAIRFVNYEY